MEYFTDYSFLILFKVTYDYKFKVFSDYNNITISKQYLSS